MLDFLQRKSKIQSLLSKIYILA